MENIVLSSISLSEFEKMISEVLDNKIDKIALNKTATKITQERFASRKEVATALKVSLPTLNEYTKNGKLKSYRIGNRVLYKWDEVESALQEIHEKKTKNT